MILIYGWRKLDSLAQASALTPVNFQAYNVVVVSFFRVACWLMDRSETTILVSSVEITTCSHRA